jgi:pSer/pThr/pTyr-binding forkhead associated (FHA) protein
VYSKEHCVIELNKESGVFSITDKSSNGIFINDKRIPKEEAANLQNGDKVFFLKDENDNEMMAFVFVAVYSNPLGVKRKRSDMEVDKENSKEEEQKESKRLIRKITPASERATRCTF